MVLANIEIYGAAGCPYVMRSVALLIHNKIPFTYKQVDLQNKPAWLFEKSPLGKVPSLILENGQFIFESQVINEFIEENLPADKRIQPTDPVVRAQNKAWIEFGSNILGDLFGAVSKPTKEEHETALTLFSNKLDLFEKHAPFHGPYFNGDKIALVDLAWGGFANSLLNFDRILGIDVADKKNKHPKFYNYLVAVSSLPVVKLAALLQLQDTPSLDPLNPSTYDHADLSVVEEKSKEHGARYRKRFASSYLFQQHNK